MYVFVVKLYDALSNLKMYVFTLKVNHSVIKKGGLRPLVYSQHFVLKCLYHARKNIFLLLSLC